MRRLLRRVRRQIIELEGPRHVAAFIVEPIGNTGGILVPPPEYLPKLREFATSTTWCSTLTR
jgi:adenosylmethionine-8-amino-7-oxononanoate aminotransferase